MNWPLTPVSQVEEPRQTGERGLGHGALNVEKEDRLGCGRPPFGQAEPSGLTHSLRALSDVAVPYEVDVDVRFVGRPVFLEIEQEVRPVSWKAVLIEVLDGERESVVDPYDDRNVRSEFGAKPLREPSASPVPAWAGRRLNL